MQTVEVTAAEDADGANDRATLTHTAAGADYGSVSKDLPVTATDDDPVGLALSARTLAVSEGGSETYTVALADAADRQGNGHGRRDDGDRLERAQKQPDVHAQRLEHGADGGGDRLGGPRRFG